MPQPRLAGARLDARGEREAERLVAAGLRALDLCDDSGARVPARKGDPRKVALATLVRERTAAGNEWLAKRLEMGHIHSVSRLIRQGGDNSVVGKYLRKLKQMSICEDW